jgi:hypothetical protein
MIPHCASKALSYLPILNMGIAYEEDSKSMLTA